jgi:hypothetical protein
MPAFSKGISVLYLWMLCFEKTPDARINSRLSQIRDQVIPRRITMVFGDRMSPAIWTIFC